MSLADTRRWPKVVSRAIEFSFLIGISEFGVVCFSLLIASRTGHYIGYVGMM